MIEIRLDKHKGILTRVPHEADQSRDFGKRQR